jgi:AcrR family transcriptional regulator
MYSCRVSSEPAYTRLSVEARRRQLLKLGADLFARHSLDELSMAVIAREAGISKALLYHYFPSKADFFEATLRAAAEELGVRTEPDPDLPPAEALAASLDAFLGWIEENRVAYSKLMQSATSIGEAHTLISQVREGTAQRLLAGLAPDPTPRVRAAVHGWLGLMDGVCVDWVEHRDMERTEVHELLLGCLLGALTAAGWEPPDNF